MYREECVEVVLAHSDMFDRMCYRSTAAMPRGGGKFASLILLFQSHHYDIIMSSDVGI